MFSALSAACALGTWVALACLARLALGVMRWLAGPRPDSPPLPAERPEWYWLSFEGVDAPVGEQVCKADDLAHVSVTGALTTGPLRLRRRARWVRRLEKCCERLGVSVGDWSRGRWTPDLPSDYESPEIRVFLALQEAGARLLGGGALRTGHVEDGVYYVVEDSEGRRDVLFPSLYGALTRYACLRARTPALLSALRSRAAAWCRDVGLPVWAHSLAVASNVSMAYVPTSAELVAAERLGEHGLSPLESEA